MSLIILAALSVSAASPDIPADYSRQATAPYMLGAVMIAAYQPRDPLYPDALDMTGIDSVKHLSAIVAAMNDDARAALLQATLNALNLRISQATGETRKWLEKKKKIVEGAIAKLGR